MANLSHAPIYAAIKSGSTTHKVAFPAVDETDGDTLKTGIGGWTVKSVRAGTVTTWTTPTVSEVAGMTGVYELTLGEDTTITTDAQHEQMYITLTASGVRDVHISVDIVEMPAVKLADGVAHGGTLGSSTATLALSRIDVTSQTTDTNAVTLLGNGTGDGLNSTGGNGAAGNGATFNSGSTNSFGMAIISSSNDALAITTTAAGFYPIDLVNTADTNDGLRGNIFGTVDTVTDVTNAVSATLANGAHGGSSATLTLNRATITPTGANIGLHIDGSSSSLTTDGAFKVDGGTYPAVNFDGGNNKSGLVLAGGDSVSNAYPLSIGANTSDVSINLSNAAGTAGEGDFDGTFIRLVDDIWDETLKKSTHNVANSSGRILRLLSLASGTYDGHIVDQGTAQSGGASTIQIRAAYAGTVSQGSLVMIEEGTGAGQVREVDSYDDPTNTITIVGTWDTNPDATSDYVVIPFAMMTTTTTTGDGNITHILGTALAETTAGNIASNFDNFYDNADAITTKVVDDVGSAASAPTAAAIADAVWDEAQADHVAAGSFGLIASEIADILVDTAEIGAAGAGLTEAGGTGDHLTAIPWNAAWDAEVQSEVVDALTAEGYTSARAVYLDNLNIGENVAGTSEVTSIQNNTRAVRVVPTVIEEPGSGTRTYRIEILLYDTSGNMEAPDSAPTMTLVNQAGTDLSSRLDNTTMTLVATGHYRAIYTSTAGDTNEQLVFGFSVVEGGNTRTYSNTAVIQEEGGSTISDVNVTQWNGTAVATPTTAGVPSVALTSIGLDDVATTIPTTGDFTTWDFREYMVMTARRWYAPRQHDASGNTLKTFENDGTTELTSQAVTYASNVETIGIAT